MNYKLSKQTLFSCLEIHIYRVIKREKESMPEFHVQADYFIF